MKTYKIAVFGCGFVGGTVADFLEQGGVEVIRVDPKLYPDDLGAYENLENISASNTLQFCLILNKE